MSLNECEENNVVLEYFLESLPINNDQDNHISIPLTLPQFMTEYVPDKNESDFDCLISQEKNEKCELSFVRLLFCEFCVTLYVRT